MPTPRRCALQKARRRDVRASLRRSGRDRGAGHDRHGDPAPVPGSRSTRSSCPVGGGGLICGHRRLRQARAPRDPDHRRASRRTPTRWRARSRRAGASRSPHVGLFADGVAVKQVGKRDVPARARSYVDEMVARRHRRDLRGDQGRLRGHARDARAGRRAGDRRRRRRWVERSTRARDSTLVAIACGANMNFDRLRFVAERAELGEQREAIFAVTIPERPGSFRAFCALLGKRNITEFNYRYADPAEARTCSSASRCATAARPTQLLAALAARAASTPRPVRQRDGEAARPPPGRRPRAGRRDEILYRFEFPERPGALMRFLDSMSARLEHQPLPLPQPRRRLRPRAGRHAGSAGRSPRLPRFPATDSATRTGTRRRNAAYRLFLSG